MAVIYRQEILQDIRFFTSAPKAQFYDKLILNLDLSEFPESTAKTGRNGFSKRALLCAFIVMKCECFSCITDLVDYLNNNLIIAHYCGFNIMKPLPSYWTFDRFIRELDNDMLKKLMQSQVLKLSEMGIIDTSFIALDSTPVNANTCQNNPKSFAKNKFSRIISLSPTRTANLVFTLPQISIMSVILNTIGVTKIMRRLTALQAYRSLR